MSVLDDLLIRDMGVDDLDSVIALEKEIFPTPWSIEVFSSELTRGSGSMYLAAELDGVLVGYLGANVVGREVHITNMAVAPDVRRRGLGSAILLECIRRGEKRGIRKLSLEVRENNSAARVFYKIFGFRELAYRRGYYMDTGEQAVIMITGNIRSKKYRELYEKIRVGLAGREVSS